MSVYNQVIVDTNPNYLQSKSYSAQYDRRWFADIASAGILGSTDFALTLLGGLGIRLAPGKAWVLGGNVSDQGMYRVSSLSNADVNVPTANASNPRLDQVILRVMDNAHDGAGFNEARIEVVPGTPTAGATLTNRNGAANLATLGEASKNVLLLFDILVPASASSLNSGNIGDRRVRAKVGAGNVQGTPSYLTVAQFQALHDVVDQQEAYIQADATNGIIWHVRYNAGSASAYKWEVVGATSILAASEGSVSGGAAGNSCVSVNAPLPGDYWIRSEYYVTDGPFYTSTRIAGTTLYTQNYNLPQQSSVEASHRALERKGTVLAASAAVDIITGNNGGNAAFAQNFSLKLTPIRVSQ